MLSTAANHMHGSIYMKFKDKRSLTYSVRTGIVVTLGSARSGGWKGAQGCTLIVGHVLFLDLGAVHTVISL